MNCPGALDPLLCIFVGLLRSAIFEMLLGLQNPRGSDMELLELPNLSASDLLHQNCELHETSKLL